MAGVVEQPDIGSRQLRPEGLHGAIKGGLVEIELRAAAHEREAQRPQGLGQELGVVGGIIEPTNIAVGRIADHQRNALVGERGRRKNACKQSEERGKDR